MTTIDALLSLPVLVSTAARIAGLRALSDSESDIAHQYHAPVSDELVELVREAIRAGTDPLGTAYCTIRSPEQRRGAGQTFTPVDAVLGMFDWADRQGEVARIVDPGAGTGRYVLAGLRRYPHAIGVGVEMDPLVALLLRANAQALGVADRLEVRICDFRTLTLSPVEGRTLFIGNPPYVRHHEISPGWKEWYTESLRSSGHAASQLAGLHLHFFAKTRELAQPGDLGTYITAAEWLDVGYGKALRELLTNGLGGQAIYVVSPEVPVFGDAMVSACITCFAPGTETAELEFKRIERVEDLRDLSGGHTALKERARIERTWSVLVRNRTVERPEGFIELGEVFRVSRGAVTGMNAVWVTDRNRFGLPDAVLQPAITDASDIVRAPGAVISETGHLRRVIDLPADLETLSLDGQRSVSEFLAWAKSVGAHESYIAKHRKPWWRVGYKAPPPIVMTYMGRRPPRFAINRAGAKLINVAHGLYPRVPVDALTMERLVSWLNENVSQDDGRVYAGGLTKFEPGEVMRLSMPSIDTMRETHGHERRPT
jgi:hypothetical protein